MQITPDGNDLVTTSVFPEYQQVYKVSDLSSDGEYPTTAFPNSVSISGDGTVPAGTDSVSNEVFVFAPGGSTPLNTYNFGSSALATDGVALTPDGSELFAITTEVPCSIRCTVRSHTPTHAELSAMARRGAFRSPTRRLKGCPRAMESPYP